MNAFIPTRLHRTLKQYSFNILCSRAIETNMLTCSLSVWHKMILVRRKTSRFKSFAFAQYKKLRSTAKITTRIRQVVIRLDRSKISSNKTDLRLSNRGDSICFICCGKLAKLFCCGSPVLTYLMR